MRRITKQVLSILMLMGMAQGVWADVNVTMESTLRLAVQASQKVTLGADITLMVVLTSAATPLPST